MLDFYIFIGFLIINIILGLLYSRGVHTVRDYAVGDKTFSTATIVATTVAVVLSGSGFLNDLSLTYTHGLYYVWPSLLSLIVSFLLVAFVFAPRMKEFLHNISIAEAMGDMYGKEVRIITGIAGVFAMSSLIAMQLKVAGKLFEYGFGMPYSSGVIIVGFIITGYSSLGGIKSVTFTDVIQFITLGTIIPTIAYFIVSTIGNYKGVIEIFQNSDLYNYKEVFDFTRPKSLEYLTFFFAMSIPCFAPNIFQRIVIAQNTSQITRANIISCIICVFIILLTLFISLLVQAKNPNLHGDDVLLYILDNYSYAGMRGLTLVGVMAMVMSTADSYINSISVVCVHDIYKPMVHNMYKESLDSTKASIMFISISEMATKIKKDQDELLAIRLISFLIGCLSILFATKYNNLLELLRLALSFYLPIVTAPFIIALFSFRPHKICVLIGMAGGFLSMIMWKFLPYQYIDSALIGLLANSILLFLSHYLLGLPGGWVNKKDMFNQLNQASAM